MRQVIKKLSWLFSCEDAALQVLMSVCPCVCRQPENLPFYILIQHTECSRMFQNVPECMQKVSKCSRMHSEWFRMFQNACRMFQNACRMFENECRMFQKACRMFQNVPECMQIHELACRSMSLDAVI